MRVWYLCTIKRFSSGVRYFSVILHVNLFAVVSSQLFIINNNTQVMSMKKKLLHKVSEVTITKAISEIHKLNISFFLQSTPVELRPRYFDGDWPNSLTGDRTPFFVRGPVRGGPPRNGEMTAPRSMTALGLSALPRSSRPGDITARVPSLCHASLFRKSITSSSSSSSSAAVELMNSGCWGETGLICKPLTCLINAEPDRT